MMKVRPALRTVGTSWDHLGKTEISQIFISWSNDWIDSIQFAYVEDGGTNAVLSENIGGGKGSTYMESITFDCPSEYITRVSGRYRYDLGSNYLWSITFDTNKGTYGPYLPLDDRNLSVINFNYHIGGKFCGFFGTYLRDGIESIGVYMKPLELDNPVVYKMMKVGPTFSTRGTPWDNQGKAEITQIFISCSQTYINYMYFAYIENGRYVLSDKFGGGQGSASIKTVTFDYPSEYITQISGKYRTPNAMRTFLSSITFYTNKGTYGPYAPSSSYFSGCESEFNYEIGGKFCGFFGTHTGDSIESIGFYMKPLQMMLANQTVASRHAN
ncbi:hypothetical protein POM88_018558 [Heracleum sosnowskyi]|uniref:Jacalin-type lectin domain-containing protein n=1 Tax=Heracleum sosnowskyi TaxID=360622 RepID=A0AAD8IRC1_9APIA|nr:hypothetical protein POM88_018558 [Heracleum sosnowskyi]